jgi:hypothetical protein
MGSCQGKGRRNTQDHNNQEHNTQDHCTQTTPPSTRNAVGQASTSSSLQRQRSAIASQSAQDLSNVSARPILAINRRTSQSTGSLSLLVLQNTASIRVLPPLDRRTARALSSHSSTGSLSALAFISPASSRDSITHPAECCCQLCTPNMRADERILTVSGHPTGCRCDHCHIRRYNSARRPSLFGHT